MSRRELRAWGGFLTVHSHLVRALSRDLEHRHRLTLSEFEVLWTLVVAPDEELPLNRLAEQVLLTPSGLSRLVDRLQRRGLVLRRPRESDARSLALQLTPAGQALFETANADHVTGVRDLFLGHLSPGEQDRLGDRWHAMVQAIEAADRPR